MRSCYVPVAIALLTAGCPASDDPTGPPAAANSVVVTRADNAVVTIAPTVWAWCGPWEAGEVEQPTLHVIAGSQAARWELRVVRRDVTIGTHLKFPNTFIWDDPRGADMFVHDPPNEASTQADGSSGFVVVNRLDCSADGSVSATIDAVLGSELGNGPPVRVRGTIDVPLTGPPG